MAVHQSYTDLLHPLSCLYSELTDFPVSHSCSEPACLSSHTVSHLSRRIKGEAYLDTKDKERVFIIIIIVLLLLHITVSQCTITKVLPS